MRNENAERLLARVMDWRDQETLIRYVPLIQLLAAYKYDEYQRFGPGQRFVESLALWLNQFRQEDRPIALDLVLERLVFLSDLEFAHLVAIAYPDVIVQERERLVAEEYGIPSHRVGQISNHPRFQELRLRSLYLGLSDGARTDQLRRSSSAEISNEQIWHAYELGHGKASEMLSELRLSMTRHGTPNEQAHFNVVWLVDDFSGSGNTYIRYDAVSARYKGKLPKIYEHLHSFDLIERANYEIYLLLYAATKQAVDHIEYWIERFTSDHGFKPVRVRVLCLLDEQLALTHRPDDGLARVLVDDAYYDPDSFDKNIAVGGTLDAKLGFAACALPLVLGHNTPNNSVYLLWGPESMRFRGLFPRVSRHREF